MVVSEWKGDSGLEGPRPLSCGAQSALLPASALCDSALSGCALSEPWHARHAVHASPCAAPCTGPCSSNAMHWACAASRCACASLDHARQSHHTRSQLRVRSPLWQGFARMMADGCGPTNGYIRVLQCTGHSHQTSSAQNRSASRCACASLDHARQSHHTRSQHI